LALSPCWQQTGSLKPGVSGLIGAQKQANVKSATFCATYCRLILSPQKHTQ